MRRVRPIRVPCTDEPATGHRGDFRRVVIEAVGDRRSRTIDTYWGTKC